MFLFLGVSFLFHLGLILFKKWNTCLSYWICFLSWFTNIKKKQSIYHHPLLLTDLRGHLKEHMSHSLQGSWDLLLDLLVTSLIPVFLQGYCGLTVELDNWTSRTFLISSLLQCFLKEAGVLVTTGGNLGAHISVERNCQYLWIPQKSRVWVGYRIGMDFICFPAVFRENTYTKIL